MSSSLKVNKIEPTDTSQYLELNNVVGVAGSGLVVAMHCVQNNNRTSLSDTSATELTWGTFTKLRPDTNIAYHGQIAGHDSLDRDESGHYIAFGSSRVAKFKQRTGISVDVNDLQGELPILFTGKLAKEEVPYAEQYTVYWGWDQPSSQRFNVWNANSIDDYRVNGQRVSTILFWEYY